MIRGSVWICRRAEGPALSLSQAADGQTAAHASAPLDTACFLILEDMQHGTNSAGTVHTATVLSRLHRDHL